jgi:spore photoproduct lyase
MQKEIINQIQNVRQSWFDGQITFYASNYADLLATENISHFHEKFLPFCESLPDNVLIETRTKSANITTLLDYAENLNWNSPTQKIEIAFSLSPRIIAQKYELWTANLDEKLQAINQLLEKWFRIGLRFLPLLPVENFQQIYSNFLDEIIAKIDIDKIASITIAPLIFNQWDYNILIKKYQNDSDFSFINNLQQNEHKLRTCSDNEISDFKEIFTNKFQNKNLFRDDM